MKNNLLESTHKYDFLNHKKHHHINASKYIKHNKRYFKLDYNQLLVLDSLLETGGYEKKYIDKLSNLRFSEHFGLLDFNKTRLEKIIVSAKTNREDKDDLDILLPTDLPDIKDYEYMFHTHPPTPFPGSRAVDGVLYEFPSISDIYHFADHYNSGETQGSLVIAPEGMYIIRARDGIKKIDYPKSDKVFKKLSSEVYNIQKLAIEKYGILFDNNLNNTNKLTFDTETFYSVIAYDNHFLKMFNNLLEKYWGKLIKIYLKPRSKNEKTGKWILKSVLLPVIAYELK
jgi:hypothetical protein